uniref:Uncharacterized protein AlNc14C118G6584 n=1 Tax=Albugo laibachii Nc14 TaxID=890382 RepID=F0WJ53_9STRA|nr:conserved hypothetical protein [Albugo laibachii Nc14]|eukprot:CCA21299.1 conserved hypothetical protein [Albugo laibachii Nc14]
MSNENALARNLLHSVLVSFPKEIESEADRTLVAEAIAGWIPALSQQKVFASVSSFRFLNEFQAKILHIIETNGHYRITELSCLHLLCLLAQQCSHKVLEPLILRYVEAILNLLRPFGNDADVYTQICILLQALFQYVKWYTPKSRREILATFPKLIPILITKLTEIANIDTPESPALQAQDPSSFGLAISSGIGVLKVLLEQVPSSMRAFTAKMEAAISVVFYTTQSTNLTYSLRSIECIGVLANASDAIAPFWLQITSMFIEILHLQLDLLDGKRADGAKAQQPKNWIRNSVKEHQLPGYQRANLIFARCQLSKQALLACLKNDHITELEIQQVTPDVIALVRRAISIEASQVGPQGVISSDGYRLPASNVYGILPGIQAIFLEVFGAFVSASGLTALRHTTSIARIFTLAFSTVHSLHRSSLYDAIGACVSSLGASTLSKLGSMLNPILVHLKQELVATQSAHERDAQVDTATQSTKGKKRKRQQSDLMSLFDNNDILRLPSWGSTRQRLVSSNMKAAVSCASRMILVYGGLLPAATRCKVSTLTRFLSQCDLYFESEVEKTQWENEISFLLLANSISPTESDRHMKDLTDAMEFFKAKIRVPLCQLGVSVGESLIHPRAPPLSIETSLGEHPSNMEIIEELHQEKLPEWEIIEPEVESDEKKEQEQQEFWPKDSDVWEPLSSESQGISSAPAIVKEKSPNSLLPSIEEKSPEDDDFPAIVEDESDS